MVQLSPGEEALWKFAILTDGILVFFMQVGFVALEVGHGRTKNVKNILLKNIVAIMLSSFCWWAYGYAFANGKSAGGIIGSSYFFYDATLDNLSVRPWFFSWAFLLCANTIPSGCLAERTQLIAYPSYTWAMTSIIHPLAAHWSWNARSWLHTIVPGIMFLDFAGGCAIHLAGGMTGLVGAALCGPRIGRFEDGMVKSIPGHDMTFATIGTFMLWFGWYGFNCGSTYLYLDDAVRRVALNTTLSSSAAGMMSMLLVNYLTGTYDLTFCCNGLLSGLVMATSTCGFIHSWAAFVTGGMAGAIYVVASRWLVHFGIDDPLDSSAVHLSNGLLGTMLIAVFGDPQYIRQLTDSDGGGILYTSRGWGQLGVQAIGVTAVAALSVVVGYAVFRILHDTQRLRVDQTTELAGIDFVDHAGPEFNANNSVSTHRMSPTANGQDHSNGNGHPIW